MTARADAGTGFTTPAEAGVFDHGHGIATVDTHYDGRAMQTAAHILVEDGCAAILDTGAGPGAPHILRALAARGVPPEQVEWVILTHVHLDHAAGAGTLMALCPNARLAVHPRGARHMIDPARLMAATVAIYGTEATRRVYGEVPPVPAARVLETGEGAQVSVGGRTLEFLDAPGHALHHVVVRDTATGHLFAGDSFGLSYRSLDRGDRVFGFPTTSPSQFDPVALDATLARIAALAPGAVYVAHFGRVTGVPRLAADLRRLVAAHAALGERCRAAGAGRHARLCEGVRALVHEEAARQGWALSGDALESVFALDIELNAQGLDVWLDRSSG